MTLASPSLISRPPAKGWCPGAYRPMESGDGLIVRVRPFLARLTAGQLLGLSDAARDFGSGIIDLTSRANLQLRGVRAETHGPLLERLAALGLLDADPALESRRNILVNPFWRPWDDSQRIAAELIARLGELPPLPAKFGFAVDAGAGRCLTAASADIRIERAEDGGLIVRADGMATGRAVTMDTAVDVLSQLARWFVDSGGMAAGRMARHVVNHPPPVRVTEKHAAPASTSPASTSPIVPGVTALGPAVGVAFGQMTADGLADLLEASGAAAVRVTPARVLILEGGKMAAVSGFVTDADDPLLRVDACAGMPFCPAATVETRKLAVRLAPLVPARLHVSGCAKGCAHAGPAPATLVGRDGRFDLVRDGTAWDPPQETALEPETLPARFGAADAPCL